MHYSIKQALDLRDEGKPEEAFAHLQSTLGTETDPKLRAECLLHQAILASFRDWRCTEEKLSAAMELQQTEDPELAALTLWVQGCLSYERGNYSLAVEQFDNLLRKFESDLTQPEYTDLYHDVQIRRADALGASGDVRQASRLLREYVEYDLPESQKSDLLSYLGSCYVQLEQYDEAQTCLTRAIQLGIEPKWRGLVPFYLGMCHFFRKEFHQALSDFERAQREFDDPGNVEGVAKWLAYVRKKLKEVRVQ